MFTTAQVVTAIKNDPASQRQFFGVVTIPDGQVIPTVDITQTAVVAPPSVNSTVLVWVTGSFGAKYICTLIDPHNSSSRMNLLVQGKPAMEPGELQIGTNSGGASIFLNNVGGIHLTAGTLTDEIVLDNQEIKIAAGSVDIHANSTAPTLQPHLGITSSGSIHLGIQIPTFPLATPLSGFSADSIGNVAISTGPLLTPLGSISVGTLGVATLESGLGSGTLDGGLGYVKAFPTGLIELTSVLEIQAEAPTVSINSPVINLGIGGQRLATEAFVRLLFDLHTHTSTTPGNPTTPPLIQSTTLPGALTLATKAT